MKYTIASFYLALCFLLLAAPTRAQDIALTPYVGYNTASGYSFDFDEANDGDDTEGEFSVQGGALIGLGAEVALPFSNSFDLYFRPSVEASLLPGNDYSEDDEFREENITASQNHIKISGDVIAEFGEAGATFTPYVGAGVTYASYSYTEEFERTFTDDRDEGTDVDYNYLAGSAFGLNVIGGARFPDLIDFGVPFAQVRATVGAPTPDAFGDGDDDDDEFLDDTPEMGTPISLMVGISFDL